MTWKDIAAHSEINVHQDCLLKWRKEVNLKSLNETFLMINSTRLYTVMYLLEQPRRGEVKVAAHISCLALKVSRKQLRESIHRVDPEGVEKRSRKLIKRIVYISDGPLLLAHR